MHGRHSPGAPQLTPQELADRARRVARRQDVIVSAFFGLIGLVVMAAGCILLPPAIAAAGGHGIRGVFVAEQYVSGRSGYWVGSFRASNHRLVVAHVDYNEPPSALRAGGELPALYPGGSEVFAPHGSSAWFGDLVLTLVGVAFFGWWVWYMPLRPLPRRRRLRKQAATDPLGALLLTKKPVWPWARPRP